MKLIYVILKITDGKATSWQKNRQDGMAIVAQFDSRTEVVPPSELPLSEAKEWLIGVMQKNSPVECYVNKNSYSDLQYLFILFFGKPFVYNF